MQTNENENDTIEPNANDPYANIDTSAFIERYRDDDISIGMLTHDYEYFLPFFSILDLETEPELDRNVIDMVVPSDTFTFTTYSDSDINDWFQVRKIKQRAKNEDIYDQIRTERAKNKTNSETADSFPWDTTAPGHTVYQAFEKPNEHPIVTLLKEQLEDAEEQNREMQRAMQRRLDEHSQTTDKPAAPTDVYNYHGGKIIGRNEGRVEALSALLKAIKEELIDTQQDNQFL